VLNTTDLTGEFIPADKKKTGEFKIKIMDYDEREFHEKEIKSMEEYIPYQSKPTVTWMDIDGLPDIDVIEKIGEHFNLHDLIIEDIANTGQHAMIEDFEDHIFIVIKMIYSEPKQENIIVEHVSLLAGKNFVISFQEGGGDVFEPVRRKIRQAKGCIRKMGAPYLAYAITDAIVDNYFKILEKIACEIETIEENITSNTSPDVLNTIYNLKRELLFLHRSIWPLKDVLNKIQRDDLPLLKEVKGIYLRDVYDNLIQVLDTIQTFRDMLSGIIDMHMSCSANKMNQIMKVLTIISTIFIPLSFITGFYGMEIYMPERECHWLYPVLLVVMLVIGVSMLLYFRKKKWL